MPREDIVLLLSGGVDSGVLLYELLQNDSVRNVHCVFLDYGQENAYQAWIACQRVISRLGESDTAIPLPLQDRVQLHQYKVELPTMHPTPPVPKTPEQSTLFVAGNPKEWREFEMTYIVCGRQALIMLYACLHAAAHEIRRVYIALQYEREVWDAFENDEIDWYSDSDPMFVDAFNRMMWKGGFTQLRKAQVFAPFLTTRRSKEEIIRSGLGEGFPFEDTYTCSNVPRCGMCIQCRQLRKYGRKFKINFHIPRGKSNARKRRKG